MGTAGKDTVYGHGRLYLGAPPAAGSTSTSYRHADPNTNGHRHADPNTNS